MKLILKKIVID